MSFRIYEGRSESPNDPKLSDGGGWRDGCAGAGGGAASVTAVAVRCSAWLGHDLPGIQHLLINVLLTRLLGSEILPNR